MGDSIWKDARDHAGSDEALTRIVHWYRYKDGRTCAKRVSMVRHLRQNGWSALRIAAALGLTRRWAYHHAQNVTMTKPISQETTANPLATNSSGSTAKERTK